MPRLPRPHMPLRVKLEAALLALGLDPAAVEWNHSPPLGLRERTPEGGYVPAANDPRHIVPMSKAGHRNETARREGGAAAGDIHKIAKARRTAKVDAEFQRRVLAKEPGQPRPVRSKIAGRPLRGGNSLRRRT